MSKIFYLKVNRDENYTYRNLQHWIDIVSEIPEGVAYIICDNETVRNRDRSTKVDTISYKNCEM